MPAKIKTKVSKTVSEKELMNKTISNLTDVVSSLKTDVARIKIRMGI